MKYLFLGGSCDGQRIIVEDEPSRWDVLPVAGLEWNTSPHLPCEFEEYHRHTFQVAGVDFTVYTHGRHDPALVMQRLIDGYQKIKLDSPE